MFFTLYSPLLPSLATLSRLLVSSERNVMWTLRPAPPSLRSGAGARMIRISEFFYQLPLFSICWVVMVVPPLARRPWERTGSEPPVEAWLGVRVRTRPLTDNRRKTLGNGWWFTSLWSTRQDSHGPPRDSGCASLLLPSQHRRAETPTGETEVGGDKGKKSVNAYIILTKLFSWN